MDNAPNNLDIGKQRQKTSGSVSRAETSAVTIRALILIGFILLFVNICACAGVIYQKYRVRRRESRLREEVQVITELLVSEEQPQLALHVANAMKHADWEEKKACEITTSGTVGDKVINQGVYLYIHKNGCPFVCLSVRADISSLMGYLKVRV